jgi:hypothetical protein
MLREAKIQGRELRQMPFIRPVTERQNQGAPTRLRKLDFSASYS